MKNAKKYYYSKAGSNRGKVFPAMVTVGDFCPAVITGKFEAILTKDGRYVRVPDNSRDAIKLYKENGGRMSPIFYPIFEKCSPQNPDAVLIGKGEHDEFYWDWGNWKKESVNLVDFDGNSIVFPNKEKIKVKIIDKIRDDIMLKKI